jgi:propionyl-CoA synthetase
VLDDSNKPFYRWFTGGRSTPATMPWIIMSTTGAVIRMALIYDSPVTDTITKYTYRQLRDEVAKFAGVLRGPGGGKGRPGA